MIEEEIVCSVVWLDEVACFDLETIESDVHLKQWGFYGEEEAQIIEVIGNIHEDKDLL